MPTVLFLMRVLLLTLAAVVTASRAGEQYYQPQDFARVEKIDVHMHLHRADPELIEEAIADGFRVMTINVDYPDFPSLPVQRQIAQQLYQRYPETLAFAATFSVQGFEQPGWSDQVIRELDLAIRDGAVAVKVWKNIGMDLRSAKGKMVMIDDPVFTPIFDHLEKIGIPLLGHQGEPRNCWLPVELMSGKNDREYFLAHPQYYMYLHPELPSYEDQIHARDNMLSQHPGLKFVGLHLASLEWSVTALADFLERFPGVMVDVAARIGQLQSQSLLDRELVRNFMIKYQDRIMYATDLDQEPLCQTNCADEMPFSASARQVWKQDWLYFTSDQMLSVAEFDQPVQGLHLPRQVVDKLYAGNARKTFPTSWRPAH